MQKFRNPTLRANASFGRRDLVGKIEGTRQIEPLAALSFLIAELQPEIEQIVESTAAGVRLKPRKKLNRCIFAQVAGA